MGTSAATSQAFQTPLPPTPDAETAGFWDAVRSTGHADRPLTGGSVETSVLEEDLSVLEVLDEAPFRTLHLPSIVRSSPAPPPVRTMLERREFGRRYDAVDISLEQVEDDLPGLSCPMGPVRFLADASSFDALSYSVDALLQHRKRQAAAGVDPARPRCSAFVVGAGPGGLMTAVQLALRDHRVVVCEQRETYTRNRFIGVYKDIAHLMASLGMPEVMTYDFTHYRGKRGSMLADIQTFLHAVALKLGVVIYTGAVVRELSRDALALGRFELVRSARPGAGSAGIGMTRWHHDTVARVASGVAVRFDTVVDASGGRSGLRELIVGPNNVLPLKAIARAAAARDPSLSTYFDDPDDHCAEFVESDYGCPPGLRERFAAALLAHSNDIPDEIPCFVSNIDATVLRTPIRPTDKVAGVGARIEDTELDIPPDWVVVECPMSDGRLTRYQIEGPLPQTFAFGDVRLETRQCLDDINPLTLLVRVLYAMGVPFDAVDRQELVEFYRVENSQGDASDVVATWVGGFSGLRVGGDQPIWTGTLPGPGTISYAIIGEALQSAWYRFGVGVDDTFAAASRFVDGLELSTADRAAEAMRFEKVLLARSVQIAYHLYAVARHGDQGVVGPVLTEHYIDEQQDLDVAEARLRDEAQRAAEMITAHSDVVRASDLLGAALTHQIAQSCHAVFGLLEHLVEDAWVARRAAQAVDGGDREWRQEALDALEAVLSPEDRKAAGPLLDWARRSGPAAGDRDVRREQERVIELALGRYAWASTWLRATAVSALDAASPNVTAVLARLAADPDWLVAETASGRLGRHADRYLTIDKVLLLEKVSLFATIPHEVLAGIARALTDQWVDPDQPIITKGDLGDCLYLIGRGRVRVHDGERLLQYLGEHEYFGELSLLDAEPRSADVTGVEPTHLFRLAQRDFAPLMIERPEILRAISRVLCQRLRTATASAAV